MVIGKTISGGRNVRSICNKILIQINSKVGGIPYNVDDLPFVDKPTMVVGMSKTKFQSGSIVTISASCNKFFSKFIHKKTHSSGGDANLQIQPMFESAFADFFAIFKVIVLRSSA